MEARYTIRPATLNDCVTIVNLIHDLAVYEKLEHEAKATPEAIALHLFGPRPYAEAVIAEVESYPVGFALFFHNYSTFKAKPGIYLEDLFVKPEHRGKGIGKGLLAHLGKLAVERGCGRLEWSVLDWNAPSIAFYKSLGAQPMDEWTIMRVTDDALTQLAALASAPEGQVSE